MTYEQRAETKIEEYLVMHGPTRTATLSNYLGDCGIFGRDRNKLRQFLHMMKEKGILKVEKNILGAYRS